MTQDETESHIDGDLRGGPPADRPAADVGQLRDEIHLLSESIADLRTEVVRLRRAVRGRASGSATTVVADPRLPVIGSRAAFAWRPVVSWLRLDRVGAWLANQRERPEWVPRRPLRWDAAAILLVLVVAAALRFIDLETVPFGVHVDEAWGGLEAQRVIDTGWIGLFTLAGPGDPTGMSYLETIPIRLFGFTVFGVRALAATLGVLSVIVFYVAVRRSFGLPSAVLGAAMLALSGWHLLFSRMGLVTISWMLVVATVMLMIGEGHRRKSILWWGLAGGTTAIGIYLYNGHALYVLVLALFFACYFFGWRGAVAAGAVAIAYFNSHLLIAVGALLWLTFVLSWAAIRAREQLKGAAAVFGGFLLVASPMLRFIRNNRDIYFARSERLSVFNSESWREQQTVIDQATFMVDRYREFWKGLSFTPRLEDAYGVGLVPMIEPTLLAVMVAGMFVSLVFRRSPLILLGVITVLLMPIATTSYTELSTRRSMAMLPFLIMFGAIGIVQVARLAFAKRRSLGYAVLAGLLVVAGSGAYQEVNKYFTVTARSPELAWNLGPELMHVKTLVDELPDDVYIYWYSGRWLLTYQTFQFLIPDVRGETRGNTWGTNSVVARGEEHWPVFILEGGYSQLLAEIQRIYPGGTVITAPTLTNAEFPAFVAYIPAVWHGERPAVTEDLFVD